VSEKEFITKVKFYLKNSSVLSI